MITLFSGMPGNGKSLKIAGEIMFNIRFLKRNCIVLNMNVNPDYVCRKNKKDGKLLFCPTYDLIYTPKPLYDYALKYHEKGKEGQTLVIFDEVQDLISTEACKAQKQKYPDYVNDWTTFFSQHRHLGYDVYLVTQYDRMIHPAIRYLIEYNYVHRKFRNAGDMGFFLSSIFKLFTGKELFIQIQKWRANNEKISSSFYTFSKKKAKIYDSYKKFDDFIQKPELLISNNVKNTIDFVKQMDIFFPTLLDKTINNEITEDISL